MKFQRQRWRNCKFCTYLLDRVSLFFILLLISAFCRVCLVQSTSFDAACLQHPSVQRLLADHLLLHSHNNDGGAGDTARLLAVSSSAGSENSAGCATAGEQSMEVSRLVDCASRVLSTAELCQSVAELVSVSLLQFVRYFYFLNLFRTGAPLGY